MPVIYNSKALIPAPFVQIDKVLERAEDGRVRRKYFKLTVKGKLFAWKGSPGSTGVWYTGSGYPADEQIVYNSRLTSLLTKQGALVELFADGGLTFEIQPLDGTTSTKCQPRVVDITFADGKWFDYTDYTITLEADNVLFGTEDGLGGSENVQPDESWSFEIANEPTRTFRVSHTVSSQQKSVFNVDGTIATDGWEVARGIVLPYLGQPLPTDVASDLAGYIPGNYVKVVQADESAGKYQVTENWIYTYGVNWTEEYAVTHRYSLQDGRNHVTVEGTLTGFAPSGTANDPASTSLAKYTQANNQWGTVEGQLLTRAQNYTGLNLNPTPISKQTGRNTSTGVITYSREFDDRVANSIAGALSQSITVANEDPSDLFAKIPVLGRPAGPILQALGSATEKTTTVTIEAVLPPQVFGGTAPSEPNTDSIVSSYQPAGSFVTKPIRSWSPMTGRYSRSVTFVWE